MTRDEVLERLEVLAGQYERALGHSLVADVFEDRAKLLRAAAEIIRQSGWRPIAEAPENQWLFVGKHALKNWYNATMRKTWAIANGYTHYLPEPAPPAREESKSKNGEENDRQNQDNKCIG